MFATVDEYGILTGFFEPSHKEIPETAFEISQEIWLDWIEKQFTHKFMGGKLVLTDQVDGDLDQLKSILKTRIDELAEAERMKYITPGAGQSMTYMEKLSQAKAVLNTEGADDADYPLLSGEIGLTGQSLYEVAERVNEAYQLFLEVGAVIETWRLRAKKDVGTALNAADATQAFDLAQADFARLTG